MAKEVAQTAVQKYTRDQAIEASLFGDSVDIIMVVLENGKDYTKDEIAKAIEKFKSAPIKEVVNGGRK